MGTMVTMPLETLALIIEKARAAGALEGGPGESDGMGSHLFVLEDDEAELSDDLGDNDDDGEDEDEDENEESGDEDAGDDDDEEDDEDELVALLSELNEDELAQLAALAWVGAGAYDRSNWQEALEAARAKREIEILDELLTTASLGDLIEKGLVALGYGEVSGRAS